MKNILIKRIVATVIISAFPMALGTFCKSSAEEPPAEPEEKAFNRNIRGMGSFEQTNAFFNGRERDCRNEDGTVNDNAGCERSNLNAQEEMRNMAEDNDPTKEEETITRNEPHRTVDQGTGAVRDGSREVTYTCTTRRRRLAVGYDELSLLDPTVDIIYPGSVLDGNSIPTGAYLPIISPRKPLKISASIRGAEGTISREIENPSLSSVSEAINEILRARNLGNIQPPAHNTLSVRNVYSAMGFGISAGLNIQAQVSATFQFGLGFDFSFSSAQENQKFLARFSQRYYAITIDLPGSPADLFEELPDVPPGVSPVYVSSVTYGRLVLFEMESAQSEIAVNAALEASLSVEGRLELEAHAGADYYNTIENSTIKATVIGGSGEHCNRIATAGDAGTDGIIECIEEGGQVYSDAVPVAYTLRYLRDNSIANVVLTSEYTARSCEESGSHIVPTKENMVIQLKGIGSSNNDAEAFSMGALEAQGTIHIRPTDQSPQSGRGRCSSIDEGEDYKPLWSAAGIGVGNYHTLANEHRVGTINTRIFPNRQNLEICLNLFDRDEFLDFSNNNTRVNYSQIIPFDSQHLGSPAGGAGAGADEVKPIPLRFVSGGVWFELYLYKVPINR